MYNIVICVVLTVINLTLLLCENPYDTHFQCHLNYLYIITERHFDEIIRHKPNT